MKKFPVLIAAVLSIGLISLQSCKQGQKKEKEEGTKVPDVIQKAFQTKYAEVKNVTWKMEEDSVFEAEFVMDSIKMSADFDKNGNWQETECKIDVSTLPAAISDTLNVLYGGFNIEKAEISESPELGKVYEVSLRNDSISTEVVLDENGKVIKKEKAEKEEK